ncbi:MAG: hypothetical protein JWM96_1246 [Alphaproteobacteria bacterium]|nr:hypothetical protein [Alphaproteobacteria bacterium]
MLLAGPLDILPADREDIPLLAELYVRSCQLRGVKIIRLNKEGQLERRPAFSDLVADKKIKLLAEFEEGKTDIFKAVYPQENLVLGYHASKRVKNNGYDAALLTDYYALPSDKKAGSALMNHFLEKSRQENIEMITLCPTRYAIPIYDHYGFKESQGNMYLLLPAIH